MCANVAGVLITSNEAEEYGGGFFGIGRVWFQSDDGVEFVDNVADSGGGGLSVFASTSSDVGMYNISGTVIFRKNRSRMKGGAWFVSGKDAKVTMHGSAIFDNNDAYEGGCIYMASGTVLDISGAQFLKNEVSMTLTSQGRGGALFLFSQKTVMSGCNFTENRAMTGAAVWVGGASMFTVNKCNFDRNSAISGRHWSAIEVMDTITIRLDAVSFDTAASCQSLLVPSELNYKWETQEYSHCHCDWTWKEMRERFKSHFYDEGPRYRTGALGKLMVPDKYEVWLCIEDHYCSDLSSSDSWFCWVFNEQTQHFVPWAPNSKLHLLKI